MITHVAIKDQDKIYALKKPNRHHDVIHKSHPSENAEQGFLVVSGLYDPQLCKACASGTNHAHTDISTSQTRFIFLNRTKAFIYAKSINQLNRNPKHYQGSKLFSEDLW